MLTCNHLDGKYSHAAVWGLLPGYELSDGKRHYPLTAMVANLAKPTPDRPALLRHDDVTTFFHEMGHVFHGLLSRTRYARFHGTAVARDFVEAPSQMLENWSVSHCHLRGAVGQTGCVRRCWEPEVLKKMSSHYKTQAPLSDDLIAKIIKRCVAIACLARDVCTDSRVVVAMSTSGCITSVSSSLPTLTCRCTTTVWTRTRTIPSSGTI